jgi:hypothetical protein
MALPEQQCVAPLVHRDLTFYTNFDHLPYYKIIIIMYFNYNIIYYIM